VRPAGELLGLSPPAAPREIVLLDAILVNAYNTYLVDHEVGAQPISALSVAYLPGGQPAGGTDRLSAVS